MKSHLLPLHRVVALLLAAVPALADPPIEKMIRSAVRIETVDINSAGQAVTVTVKVGDKTKTFGPFEGHASGFVIGDGRYIITNYHVCCMPTTEIPLTDEYSVKTGATGTALFIALEETKEKVRARTIWSSLRKDLAVLELEKPLNRPAVTFSTSKYTKVGQKVWTAGFPKTTEDRTDARSDLTAKIHEGNIVGKVRTAPGRGLLNEIDVYQTSLLTSQGGSGGPVYDECGRVIGIHSSNNAYKEAGVKYEIFSDELLPELDRLKISYSSENSGCIDYKGFFVTGLQFGGGGLALMAVFIATSRRGREMVKKVTTRRPDIPLPQPGLPKPPMAPIGGAVGARANLKPILKGVKGYYGGNSLDFGPEPFTIGRDGKMANLVYPPDTDSVSRRHCVVRYDAGKKKFLLEDCGSTNGTFLKSGEKLNPGRVVELSAGDQFYVGHPDNTFEVRLEVQ